MSETGVSGPALAGSAITMAPIYIATLFADFGSSVATQTVYLDTNYCADPTFNNSVNPCFPPRLSIDRWALDVITATLTVVAVSLVYVIALWAKQPKNISAETTSIAGVATLMGHPQVETDFATIPSEMSQTELARFLKDKKYALGTFNLDGGTEKFGIVPIVGAVLNKNGRPKRKPFFQRFEGDVVERKAGASRFGDWKKSRFYFDIASALFLLTLLGLTIAAVANVDDPRRVFIYSTQGATIAFRVSFCIVGIIVARYWTMLFRDVQNFAPYRRLHAGPQRAKSTINKRGYSLPMFSIIPLLRMRYFLPASVAVTSLLAEVLVVCLAGLPYRPGQLRGEFIFCGVTASVILVIMLVNLALFVRWRKALPHLPRRPDSVAAVMTYVANTNFVRDFDGLETAKTRDRDRAIENMGKRFAYGVRIEEDGRKRWVIDEVFENGYEHDQMASHGAGRQHLV